MVIEDENSITAFPPDLGVIQGDSATVKMMVAALGLDHSQIQNLDMTEVEKQVLKNKIFGQRIMNKFIAMRADVPASPEEDLAIMDHNVLGDVRALLYDGSIKSARKRLITKTDDVLPLPIRDQFVQEMADYLIENGYTLI